MKIRRFIPGDSASLAQIYHEAVRTVGINYYAPTQVEAWSAEPVKEGNFLNRVLDDRSIFVTVDKNDNPVAFIELEKDGHIDCFYCRPNVIGIAGGAALYERLESAARAASMSRLYVKASSSRRNS